MKFFQKIYSGTEEQSSCLPVSVPLFRYFKSGLLMMTIASASQSHSHTHTHTRTKIRI